MAKKQAPKKCANRKPTQSRLLTRKQQNTLRLIILIITLLWMAYSYYVQLRDEADDDTVIVVPAPVQDLDQFFPLGSLVTHQLVNQSADGDDFFYSVGYSSSFLQPEWVFYQLTTQRILSRAPDVKRKDNFRADPRVPVPRLGANDYKDPVHKYDRGHLAPAEAFGFSQEAMDASFFMTNMAPQEAALNRGIWKNLEELERKWARQHGTIYVIAGGVLEAATSGKPALTMQRFGAKDVPIPNYFYKILFFVDKVNQQEFVMAFLFPQPLGDGHSKDLTDYLVSVRMLEKITNIDFFGHLELDYQERFEPVVAHKLLTQVGTK